MNAVEIWKKQGGFVIHKSGQERGQLLVDLHAMRETGKPAKNIRFRFQVMCDDANQSMPVQFRSRDMAYQYMIGCLAYTDLLALIRTKRARVFPD
jgi:hypothetical protein